jgi:hypothetical protein
MKLGLGCCLLVTLGLIACGGTTGSTSVSGDNPAAIKAAPAGVSTLVFMDLELVRPDNLTGATELPTGVTANGALVPQDKVAPAFQSSPAVNSPINPTTLTFNNCTAANGGVMNGTIVVGWVVAGSTTTYTETFNLTVTTTTPAQTWVYAGQQVIAVTGTTASVSVPGAIAATFTDNTVTPAAVKVYQFTIPAPLAVDWTLPSHITLSGEYEINLPSVETVTVTLQPALIWDSAVPCNYPIGGTLTLDLVSAATGTDSTTVVFSSTCGAVTLAGVNFNLGQ